MSDAVAVRERPLLMSGPMVRAILDGTKTQTRRAMRLQPPEDAGRLAVGLYHPTVLVRGDEEPGAETFGAWTDDGEWSARCPYGQPGDRLYVRETWAAEFYWPMPGGGERRQWSAMPTANRLPSEETFVAFRATNTVHGCDDSGVDPFPCAEVRSDSWKWKPSIHMPRWASRLTLELTEVRVERVQDISEDDAIAEGIEPVVTMGTHRTFVNYAPGLPAHLLARESYRTLWDSINGKRNGGAYAWQRNVWVWVLSFAKVPS